MKMHFSVSLFSLAMLFGACSSDTQPTKEATTPSVNETAVAAKPVALIDEKNGFRQHHFGDDFSSFTDLVLTPGYQEPGTGVKRYEKKKGKENLQIGEVKLDNIVYTFHNGKLLDVMLYTNEQDGLEKMVAAVTALYGEPSYKYSSGTGGVWKGEKAEAYTETRHISGSYGSADSDTHYLYIKSKTVAAQMAADKQSAGKKASADL